MATSRAQKKPSLIEEVRRRQIVDTAIRTIASRGFAHTTLNDIAEEAGYGTEAAFSRAFSRQFGTPPATWRQRERAGVAS